MKILERNKNINNGNINASNVGIANLADSDFIPPDNLNQWERTNNKNKQINTG